MPCPIRVFFLFFFSLQVYEHQFQKKNCLKIETQGGDRVFYLLPEEVAEGGVELGPVDGVVRPLSNRQQWVDALTELNPPPNHVALRRTSLGPAHGAVGSHLFDQGHDDDAAEYDRECPDTPRVDDDGGIPTMRLPSLPSLPYLPSRGAAPATPADSAAEAAIDMATPLGPKPPEAFARAKWMLKKRALDRLNATA